MVRTLAKEWNGTRGFEHIDKYRDGYIHTLNSTL